MNKPIFSLCFLGALVALSACESTSTPAAAAPASIEIAGTWVTPFGEDVITKDKWNTAKVAAYDNAKNVAYTQNAADDKYNPNQFNKVVWTEPKGDTFYYCIADYGKGTLALAQASTLTADDKDPENAGCGGKFPWTKCKKKAQ